MFFIAGVNGPRRRSWRIFSIASSSERFEGIWSASAAPLRQTTYTGVIIHISTTVTEKLMPQFSVNPQRFDPYKNFKFRVKWDGRYVAGVSKISALTRKTEVIVHREGGDPSTSRKSPGRTEYAPITLERGVTHDTEFEKWANKVWNYGSGLGMEVSLKDLRKDIIIEMYNEAGQLVIAYKVYRCWVSEYQAQPDLDANANAVAIQHIKLENEGWERDYEVHEPAEPSYTKP